MAKNAATMRLFRGIMTTFTEEKAISDMIRADDERPVKGKLFLQCARSTIGI